jgi:hypothetical protein
VASHTDIGQDAIHQDIEQMTVVGDADQPTVPKKDLDAPVR